MERNITVKVQATGELKSFTATDLQTVAHLKKAMRTQGINVDNVDIKEGISNTTLNADDSLLPTNMPYRGGTTNNLIILLVRKDKKVASGTFTRSECYTIIKEKNLQEGIKVKYGRNYTQVTTQDLVDFVTNTICSEPNTTNDACNTSSNKEEENPFVEFLLQLSNGEYPEDAANFVLNRYYRHNINSTNNSAFSQEELDEAFGKLY